jgi:hypothetical protein
MEKEKRKKKNTNNNKNNTLALRPASVPHAERFSDRTVSNE